MWCFMDLQMFLPVMIPHQITNKKSTGLHSHKDASWPLHPQIFRVCRSNNESSSPSPDWPLSGPSRWPPPGLLELLEPEVGFLKWQCYSRVLTRKWTCLWDSTSPIFSIIITYHFRLLVMWIHYCLRQSRCWSARGNSDNILFVSVK